MTTISVQKRLNHIKNLKDMCYVDFFYHVGFSPTFAKRPVEEVVYGAIGGNASFTCHPDAAPYPTIKWLKNGVEMNLVAGDTNSRIILLANGNLLITNINNNDAGYYTCAVENVFGTASSSGQLTITGGQYFML